MDIDMAMDDLIKRDKKKGRLSNNGALRQGPLPGKGRGGRNNNTDRARAQPKIRNNANRIQKRPNNQQRPQQQNMVQNNQQLKKNAQNQNMNQRPRLTGNQNATALPMTAGQRRRQRLRELRRNAQNRGRLAPLANSSTGQPRNTQAPLRKRQPLAPVVAQRQNQQQQNNLQTVQGTLAERKIKVRNIDARVVSVDDLKKLFGKCGPLVTASFDTNEFGSYLGTATVIYMKASSAARAIKDYNLAQIDTRPMKVQYAITSQTASPLPRNNSQPNTQQQRNNAVTQQRKTAVRRTNNRIGKSGRGRTLNVMGNGRGRARQQ